MTDRQYDAKPPVHPELQVSGSSPGPVLDGGQGSTWVVNVSGTDTVEMTRVQIAQAWMAGHVSETTLVWRQGMGEWTPLGAVPQLAIDVQRGALPSHAPQAELALHDCAGPDPQRHEALEIPEPELDVEIFEDEELSEDEVTELWGADQQVSDVGAVQSAHSCTSADPATEQLSADEVAELWAQQGDSDEPSLSFGYSDLDAEDLSEDEVTELSGDQAQASTPSVAAEDVYADGDELEVSDVVSDGEVLSEDEVTAVYEEGMPDSVIRLDRELERPTVRLDQEQEQASAALAKRLITELSRDRGTGPAIARAAPALGDADAPLPKFKPTVWSGVQTVVSYLSVGASALRDTFLLWVRRLVRGLSTQRGSRARAAGRSPFGAEASWSGAPIWQRATSRIRRAIGSIQGMDDGRCPAPPARAIGLSLVPVALVAGERKVRERCASGARWVAQSRARAIATGAMAIVVFAVLVAAGLYARGGETASGLPARAGADTKNDVTRAAVPSLSQSARAAVGTPQRLDAVSGESLPTAVDSSRRSTADGMDPGTAKMTNEEVARELEKKQAATIKVLKKRSSVPRVRSKASKKRKARRRARRR